MELTYIKNDPKPQDGLCRYNPGVECDRMRCGSCGWNPSVANNRTVNFMLKLEAAYGRG